MACGGRGLFCGPVAPGSCKAGRCGGLVVPWLAPVLVGFCPLVGGVPCGLLALALGGLVPACP